MPIKSLMGTMAQAIAEKLPSLEGLESAFDTAPAAVWLPDYENEKLQKLGLQCYVIPVLPSPELGTRKGGARGGEGTYEVHLAVMLPTSKTNFSPEEVFEDGDRAVYAAELVIEKLLGVSVSLSAYGQARCIEAAHDPVVSRDYLRQLKLWLSYVKTTWKRTS